MSGGWNTIESDAGVFTYLLDNLGVQNVQFEELLSLDPSTLAELYPIYGVIFLFKYPTDKPYTTSSKPLDGEFDHTAGEELFFAAQTIQNACGTQALLSVLMNKQQYAEGSTSSNNGSSSNDTNNPERVNIGPALDEFRDFTMFLPPDIRGEALGNSELIRDVHNSFAKSSPFASDEKAAAGEEAADAFHFIAYASLNDVLYELDGLQPAPITHGSCTNAQFPEKVMEVLQRRVARYEASEIRFNLLAMVRDLRIRAREIGDLEMLAREERKRRDWRFENALRRHNFVGFAGEVLKGVVKKKLDDGGETEYKKWVDDATVKMKRRLESTRKPGEGGKEDVDMKD